MINDYRPIKFLRLLLILEFLFLAPLSTPSTLAAEPDAVEKGVSFKRSVSDERVELFVAMLKRRAQQILEARRIPPPPLITISADITHGHESNVNLDGNRVGDYFTQESLDVSLRPQFNSWFSAELSYDLFNSHFMEIRDANLWMNTLTGKIHIKPHSRILIETGYKYAIVNFPFDTANSFFDQRTNAHIVFAQTGWLSHRAGWTYQLRDFDTRKIRTPDGIRVTGVDREDSRQIVSYETRFRFPKTSARLTAQFYQNFSNDRFQGFYDWEDFQLRWVMSRIINSKWIGVLVNSYERKNYQKRIVPDIDIAERDNLITLVGSIIYQINDRTDISYALTYRHQDSNDPRLDFTDVVNEFTFSVSF